MKTIAMINTTAVKTLERTILVAGSTTLAISLFMLANAGFNYFRRTDAESQLAITKQQINSLNETISKSKRLKFPAPTERELTIVLRTLDQYAKVYDCQLTEVISNNDEGNYMSRYKKGAAEAKWKQLQIQCEIVGSVSNTISLLREVTSKEIPIELQTIEVTPIDRVRFGHPQVQSKVVLQIMRQEAVVR